MKHTLITTTAQISTNLELVYITPLGIRSSKFVEWRRDVLLPQSNKTIKHLSASNALLEFAVLVVSVSQPRGQVNFPAVLDNVLNKQIN